MAGSAQLYAFVIADTNDLIRHWNRGAEQLFGYSAAEAEGQSLDLVVPHGRCCISHGRVERRLHPS